MTANTNNQGGRQGFRWRTAAWSAAIVLMLLPMIAMQFTDEVRWDVLDFVILGAFLVAGGLILEMASRKSSNPSYRYAVGIAVVAGFLLAAVNGSVGVIGNEDNPANLMYAGVLALGVSGALVARFKPRGMARAMFMTMLAQVAVGLVALIAGLGSGGAAWPWAVIGGTGVFAGLWMTSAWLFRKAVEEPAIRGVE